MYRISEVAKTSKTSPHTLRYYDKCGLLSPSTRSDAGYRLYSDSDLKQLRFIIMARDSGFSLDEIQRLLSIELNKNSHTCEEVTSLTRRKLNEINKRIEELSRIKGSLEKLLDSCLGGPDSAEYCSILRTLEEGT